MLRFEVVRIDRAHGLFAGAGGHAGAELAADDGCSWKHAVDGLVSEPVLRAHSKYMDQC